MLITTNILQVKLMNNDRTIMLDRFRNVALYSTMLGAAACGLLWLIISVSGLRVEVLRDTLHLLEYAVTSCGLIMLILFMTNLINKLFLE
jgi:hypothetical protein